MANIYFVLLLAVLKFVTPTILRVDPLVQVQNGLVRGFKSENGQYSMFLGIPYAEVDRNNPFGAANPYPEFSGVFDANNECAMCPQFTNNEAQGSLDCLTLNIYVPTEASSQNKLPVMVWIHGGSFTYGHNGRSLYGPDHIIKYGVIFVAINYRLGPYGFMCLNTTEVPGNQGLKDQLAALRWINDNIESFGGNKDQITISGESAGAVSVDLHLISRHEKLFDKAILQSGAAYSLVYKELDEISTIGIATFLGYETDDVQNALLFLRDADPHLVIAASNSLQYTFRPCVEKQLDGVELFIKDYAYNLNPTPKITNTPILFGYNNNEYLFFWGNKVDQFFDELGDIFYNRLHERYAFDDDEKLKLLANIVRHFYIGDENISKNVKSDIIRFVSDERFYHSAERTVSKYLKNGASRIFKYEFSYTGGRNVGQMLKNITSEDATHADELGYLFESSFQNKVISNDDQLTIDRMTQMWTNFIKYGNPTPELTDVLPVTWLPMSDDSQYYLNIDKNLSLEKRAIHDRMAFWDLFYVDNEKYLKGFSQSDS